MRFWPRFETRAATSYTDVVLAGLAANAIGSTTLSVATLGAVEACAGLWGRSFASAVITPPSLANALTPAHSRTNREGLAFAR